MKVIGEIIIHTVCCKHPHQFRDLQSFPVQVKITTVRMSGALTFSLISKYSLLDNAAVLQLAQ